MKFQVMIWIVHTRCVIPSRLDAYAKVWVAKYWWIKIAFRAFKYFLWVVGHQPWTSVFQFHRTKSRIQFDNTFWLISLLSTTKKKFPEINLHNSELMTYVHVHGRQLPKLLLHIQYYHWWLEIPMGIWIIAS